MASSNGSPSRKPTIFLSSTTIDLPDHRHQAAEACRRMGFDVVGMEDWPAQDADAETLCLSKVDEADLFIGIYAFRYGWVPPGHEVSITELEYERAKGQGKPRLLFFMDENHPLPAKLIERGDGGAKLEAFKKRVGSERVGNFFSTPNDLRGLIIHALSQREETAEAREAFPTVAIPKAPAPYIVHPYTLMHSRRLVGRRNELSLLTDWVAKPKSDVYRNPLFNFIAIGGMGKSALTWHFFEEVAPREMAPLAGRFWWSFYERDAGFEQFVPHALAYCSGQTLEAVEAFDLHSQMDQLWRILDERPFLLVLDGLERILVAYNRLDAPRMLDDELDEKTANRIADAAGLPASAGETYLARHRLRVCVDPRAGRFLQRLTRLRASRILVSSRLYPADIQTTTAHPIPGSFVHLQQGLASDDALALWRDELNVSGSREELLPLFDAFDRHPLLLQALAGEVAEYRPAPGDFTAWRRARPDFNPAGQLELKQRQSHILAHALTGLGEAPRRVLHTLAGFRMATGYATLRELLVGESAPCADEATLDRILRELEDRGLVGWERSANRYDLHPIVRSVVWAGLAEGERRGVLEKLHDHFKAQPMVENWRDVESMADLEPAIELYDKLIGLRHYQEAFELFRDRIERATLHRLGVARRRLELLRAFFPEGERIPPQLDTAVERGFILHALAVAYDLCGQPKAALWLFIQATTINEREGNRDNLVTILVNQSGAQRFVGELYSAEYSGRRGLQLAANELGDDIHEAATCLALGETLSTRGETLMAECYLRRAGQLLNQQGHRQGEGVTSAYWAQLALHQGQVDEAHYLTDHAWRRASVDSHECDFIHAARLQGSAALQLDELTRANERFHHALGRARTAGYAAQELPTLIALAELHRRRNEPKTARELLDQVWLPAERGPYPLFHADALNVLAQIERDAGNHDNAVDAATHAFELAWCDGPPYAYHWGLEAARDHLRELGAPEPQLSPFDPAAHEPMPEVEIDPDWGL